MCGGSLIHFSGGRRIAHLLQGSSKPRVRGREGVCAKREKFFVQGIPLRNERTHADTWGGGGGVREKIADTWFMDGPLEDFKNAEKFFPCSQLQMICEIILGHTDDINFRPDLLPPPPKKKKKKKRNTSQLSITPLPTFSWNFSEHNVRPSPAQTPGNFAQLYVHFLIFFLLIFITQLNSICIQHCGKNISYEHCAWGKNMSYQHCLGGRKIKKVIIPESQRGEEGITEKLFKLIFSVH